MAASHSYLHAQAAPSSPFYFIRLATQNTSRLLSNPALEPFVDQNYKLISALSLSSFADQGYYLKQLSTGDCFYASATTLLATRRPSNPGFAISFFAKTTGSQFAPLSLLIWNEFQSILGCYDHEQSTFYSYYPGDAPTALSFFESCYGDDLIMSLVETADRGLFKLCDYKQQNKQNISIYGWSKSFGHSLWNDLLGHINSGTHVQDNSDANPALLCIGPRNWVPPAALQDDSRIEYANSELSCNQLAIDNNLLIHWPIGFSITSLYDSFWSSQVSAFCTPELMKRTSSLRASSFPIIALSLRKTEYWRRPWVSQEQQVLNLIRSIKSAYPNAALILDGMTSYQDKSSANRGSEVHSDSFIAELSAILPVENMSWWPLPDKLIFYKIVNYFIGEFGSGGTLPAWVYPVPSVCLSGQPELEAAYSQPSTITRACKPILTNVDMYGPFVPSRLIRIEHNGWQLIQPEADNYILSHMRRYLCRPRDKS